MPPAHGAARTRPNQVHVVGSGLMPSLPTLPRLLKLAGCLRRLRFEPRGPLALADRELALGRQRGLGLAAELRLCALRGPASGESGAQLCKLCFLAGLEERV